MTAALLSPIEAAERLHISLKSLREHVKDGTIPVIVTGRGLKRRHYAFDPADVELFKRERKEIRSRTCQSTSRKSRRTTNTIFGSQVFDFQALRSELQKQKLGK